MSGLSDTVKYLYEKLLLRDLLSYVVPGAIVSTAFAVMLDVTPLSLSHPIWLVRSLPSILQIGVLILSFGLLQIVGLAVGFVGESVLLGSRANPRHCKPLSLLLNWPHLKRIRSRLSEGLTTLRKCIWGGDPERVRDKEQYTRLAQFLTATGGKDKASQQRERFVVLQQACGNNALALGFLAVVVGWKHLVAPGLALVLVGLGIALYLAHWAHLTRQIRWEKTIIELDKKAPPGDRARGRQ